MLRTFGLRHLNSNFPLLSLNSASIYASPLQKQRRIGPVQLIR